jgi:hypothetical protein
MTPAQQFSIEEMKAARGRIDQEIATMNNFEIVSVAAIGAIYLAFFSQRISDHYALMVLTALPVIVCGYGLFRYRAHASIVQVHEEYIKILEKQFLDRSGLVGHYDENKTGQLKLARFAFWTIIFLLSFAVFIVSVACPEKLTRIHPLIPPVSSGSAK